MLAYRKLVTAAALAALAAGTAPAARAQDAADTRPTVFVSYFTNGAIGKNNEELRPLAKGLADMLITELQANPNIRVVERTQLEELFREQNLSAGDRVDPSTAIVMGKTLGAHHMITGVYVTDGKGRMRLDLRAVDVATSRIEYTTSVTKTPDDLLDMVAQLASNTNKGMKLPAITATPRRTGSSDGATGAKPDLGVSKDAPEARVAKAEAKPKKVPFEAVLLYSKGLAAADKGNRQEAVELYRRALDKFPGYPAPKKELDRLEKAGN